APQPNRHGGRLARTPLGSSQMHSSVVRSLCPKLDHASHPQRTNLLVAVIAWCVACGSAGCGSTVATSTEPPPAKCVVTLTAPAASIDAGGATTTVAVSTQPECSWNAS